jgi:hypothetical protein
LAPAPAGAETLCEEGERWRCARDRIVDCSSGLIVGQCLRGCLGDGESIEDDGVSREAAFAILCSR